MIQIKKRVGNLLSRLKTVKPGVWLALIIIFAISLRVMFFTGFSSIDQDDGIYINLMHSAVKGNLDHTTYRSTVNEEFVNPVSAFALRPMMIYPTAYIQKIFGISDYSSTFLIILSSLGSVIVVYYLGNLFFGCKVGLLSAFFLSILPIEVIYASQLMPDAMVAFFMGLAVFLFFLGEKHQKKRYSWLLFLFSGISVGLGYLTKATALTIIIIIFIYCLYKFIFQRKYNPYWIIFFVGFFLVFTVENVYYHNKTGELFLRPQIMSKIHQTKYLQEYKFSTVIKKFPPILEFYYPSGPFFFFSKILTNLHHSKQNYVGYIYYLVMISAISSIFLYKQNNEENKKNSKLNRRFYTYILIIWIILLYLFLEFGPGSITFNNPESWISYKRFDRRERYLTILSIPSMILASYFLVSISHFRFKKVKLGLFISASILVFLTITSFHYILTNTDFYRSSLSDLKEASKLLEKEDAKLLYTDHLAKGTIDYFLGFNTNFKIKLLSENPDPSRISDSYVILGGSRGYGISYAYVLELTPDIYESYYYNFPLNWKIKRELKGPINMNREQNMRIFYVD